MSKEMVYSFIFALTLHGVTLAFLDHGKNQEAKVLLNQGESSIKLTLQPTLDSHAKPIENVDKKIIKEIEKPVTTEAIKKTVDKFTGVIRTQLDTISKILKSHENSENESAEPVVDEMKIENQVHKRVLEKEKIKQVISKAQESDLLKKGVTAKANSKAEIRPIYPPASKRRGEEGTVVYLVEILDSGKVGNIQIVQSSGYSRLDDSAFDALKKASYFPALENGKSIRSNKMFTVRFEIEDSES